MITFLLPEQGLPLGQDFDGPCALPAELGGVKSQRATEPRKHSITLHGEIHNVSQRQARLYPVLLAENAI
jgi:hypothetical protein